MVVIKMEVVEERAYVSKAKWLQKKWTPNQIYEFPPNLFTYISPHEISMHGHITNTIQSNSTLVISFLSPPNPTPSLPPSSLSYMLWGMLSGSRSFMQALKRNACYKLLHGDFGPGFIPLSRISVKHSLFRYV